MRKKHLNTIIFLLLLAGLSVIPIACPIIDDTTLTGGTNSSSQISSSVTLSTGSSSSSSSTASSSVISTASSSPAATSSSVISTPASSSTGTSSSLASSSLLSSSSSSTSSAVSSTITIPTPAAHWKFEEKLDSDKDNLIEFIDSISSITIEALLPDTNGNFTLDPNGKSGNSLLIKQFSDPKSPGLNYLGNPDESKLDFTDNLTIETWINLSTLPVSSNDTLIVGRKNFQALRAAIYGGYALLIENGNSDNKGKVKFTVQDSSGTDNTIYSDLSITTDKWNHIAAVYSNGEMFLYINGKLQLSTVKDAIIGSLAAWKLQVGGRTIDASLPENADFNLNGFIDELKIYNAALTEAQVNSILNSYK